ncbi:MAG: hypothetical protein EOP82_31475 [Variovorax sp.]|nr:MAG: hypothetical protein EOP82_31475 [Variovorax sp.]
MTLADPNATLMQRWQRLQIHVRCGMHAHDPGCIRLYVHTGLRIVRRGIQPAVATHMRVLQTLLLSAQDEALPWFWRSVCLEHVNLPLAHLASTLGVHDPIGMHALEAGVQRARDQLPVFPRMSAWGDLSEPEVRPSDLL